MHAEHLLTQHDDAGELLRVLAGYRWRVGIERTLQFAIRGLIGSGLVLIALGVVRWLDGIEPGYWIAAVPLAAALAVTVARWPSRRAAALAADRRFGLAERLGTAAEIVASRPRVGRFNDLQIRDALRSARQAHAAWLVLGARARNEAAIAGVLALLAAASLLLAPTLPRPAAETSTALSTAAEAAPTDMAMRTVQEDAADVGLMTTRPTTQTRGDADLASRVQQEQAERSALDSLAQALGSVSAGQAAADAIEQGNYTAARDQLQNLGEEADQLSDAAKKQLAQALQQASATTTQTDRQLADRERQAAQALGRSSYTEQRQALRGLADQVERSGARSVPAEQLQRDIGQLQQQTGGARGASARGQASNSAADGAAQTTSAASAGAADGAQGGLGKPGGPGVGTDTDPNVFSDEPSRLETAGQQVTVPTRLGSGPGVRPPDGTEDQTGSNSSIGGRSVSEQPSAQQTGQVSSEMNLVPGEQRPIVRGYFR